jgi:hypothetical protein
MQNRSMDRRWGDILVITGLMVAMVLGCSWPSAYLRHSWTVENQFDNHEIFTKHQYFTGGTLEDPRAILVLKPDYQLDSPGWQPVTMTQEALAQWIDALKKDFFVGYNTFSNGAKVIVDKGEIAGYYYSVWEFPLVRMPGEKNIQLAVPRAEYRSTNRRTEFFTGDDSRDSH